jgi:signal transduction histidine kinase
MSLSVLTELITAGSFGALTTDGVKLVGHAKDTTDDLITMITNLLDLEKMQSGKMLVHKEQSQLDDILKTAASNLAPLAEKCNIELRVEHSQVAAELDQNRIVQALTSILREFVEELPAKSVVSLSCPGDKHRASIKISAPNVKESSSSTSRKDHAARQRLAIDLTKLIVEQHGGQLQIRSSQDTRVVTITLRATNSGSAA